MIAGHTDRRPYSDQRHYSNWELSSDRANGARRVLVENGMKPEQIARVVGYADTQLLNEKDPFADANRRITILVLPLNEGRKPSALVGGSSEKKSSPIIPETQHEGEPETPKKEASTRNVFALVRQALDSTEHASAEIAVCSRLSLYGLRSTGSSSARDVGFLSLCVLTSV